MSALFFLQHRIFLVSRRCIWRAIIFAPLLFLVACAAPLVNVHQPMATFDQRCADPNTIRCFGFEMEEISTHGGSIVWGTHEAPVGAFVNGMGVGEGLRARVELAADQKASGDSSLKFFMPSNSGAGFAGQFYANFSDDYSVQFGEGEEFYVQWRQRFSMEFLENRYMPDSNWKQLIIGEGDRRENPARSCTQLELVVNQDNFGNPAMYHSCGGKDGRYDPIDQKWVVSYEPDQWMTFQLHVRIGTWYKNDGNYRNDSVIELWVAREGEPSRVAVSEKYDLANNNPLAKYGKIWLLPYLTRKDATQLHPDAYTWYDELVISTAPIADPIR